MSLADARHRISDYKQILAWCCQGFEAVAFSCDPGKIDDVEGTGVDPVKLFQSEYNTQREALGVPSAKELAIDGDVGPDTWGAFFDVMQYSIASELGEEPAEMGSLRAKLQWVDNQRRALGFGETHPIDRGANNRKRDNYASQSNRRVEVMFFEYGHEPDLATAESSPEACEVYLPDEYERVKLEMTAHDVKFGKVLVRFHAPRDLVPDDIRYRLRSKDGAYDEVQRGGAATPDPSHDHFRQLCFTNVIRSGTYTLEQSYGGKAIFIFNQVKYRSLIGDPSLVPQNPTTPSGCEDDISYLRYDLETSLQDADT